MKKIVLAACAALVIGLVAVETVATAQAGQMTCFRVNGNVVCRW